MTAQKKKLTEIGNLGVYLEGNERLISGEIPMYSAEEIAGLYENEDDAAEMITELSSKKGCCIYINGHSCTGAPMTSLFRMIYTSLGLSDHGKPIIAAISSVILPSELEHVRKTAAEVRNELAAEGKPVGRLCAGAGIETPSASILADLLAPMSDFFVFDGEAVIQSVKNGCTCERKNESMQEIADRCLRLTAAAARREGTAVYTVRRKDKTSKKTDR